MPPRIDVEPFTSSYHEIMEADPFVSHTELFRPDTQLNDALELALPAVNPNEYFRVISAGCSFGPEIDSVLGTMQYNTTQPTAVFGIAFNPLAVEAAQSGRYRMVASLATCHKRYHEAGFDFEQTMDTIGFRFQYDPAHPGRCILDTNELRSQHHVAVREHDLTERLPINQLAHVVLCNNVLFHFRPETAETIAHNLAEYVTPGGILSFGGKPARQRMEANTGMPHGEWLHSMGKKLAEQGLEPALYSQDVAFAFRRTSGQG